MVLRDVAEDIDMHESTISRVTTNKYVHTPRGIFELKFFFNSSIQRIHGDAIASQNRAVIFRIKFSLTYVSEFYDNISLFFYDQFIKFFRC